MENFHTCHAFQIELCDGRLILIQIDRRLPSWLPVFMPSDVKVDEEGSATSEHFHVGGGTLLVSDSLMSSSQRLTNAAVVVAIMLSSIFDGLVKFVTVFDGWALLMTGGTGEKEEPI